MSGNSGHSERPEHQYRGDGYGYDDHLERQADPPVIAKIWIPDSMLVVFYVEVCFPAGSNYIECRTRLPRCPLDRAGRDLYGTVFGIFGTGRDANRDGSDCFFFVFFAFFFQYMGDKYLMEGFLVESKVSNR